MKQGEKQTIKTDKAYFLTLTVVGWADVFTRKNHRDALIASKRHCQKNKGLIVFAYCVMSNHLHMIVNTHEPYLLKDTIRDLKKFTSRKIVEQIKDDPESRREWLLKLFSESAEKTGKHKNYKFWKEGNHAIEIYSEKFVWTKINYIHNNPIRSGVVESISDYFYSSYYSYSNSDSPIDKYIKIDSFSAI